MKKLTLFIFSCLIVIGLFWIHSKSTSHLSDPDRYYHFAISRMMVESNSFFLRSVPQVEGLGWGEYFPDKEFLFHQLTAIGYRINSDQGVAQITMACSALIFILFLVYSSHYLPTWLAALCSMALFTTPLLFFRLLLVRPHCLAIPTFLLLNIGILSRRRAILFLGGLLFVLSYHAFYLGLICIFISMIAQFISMKGSWDRKRFLAQIQPEILGVLGIVIGILLNPHFPSNVVGAWEISKIPGLMAGELSTAKFGMELYPAASNVFLTLFWVPILCAVIGLLIFGKIWGGKGRITDIEPYWIFLTLSLGFFTYLTFQSPRAIEYALPIGALFIVHILHKTNSWNRFATPLATLPLMGLLAFHLHTILTRLDTPLLPWHEEAKELLAHIPPKAEPTKIFNCEWDSTPSLMYLRPDIQFLDILDPSLLYFANREAFKAKEALRQGQVGDIHGLIRKVFKASYVLCVEPGAIFQMETDPGFRRVFPTITQVREKGKSTPILFEVLPKEIPQFVREFRVKEVEKIHRKEVWRKLPAPTSPKDKDLKLVSSHFLNLSQELKPDPEGANQDTALCAQISPSSAEMRRLRGANFLVIGGGRSLQLYINGKKTFTNLEAFSRAQTTQVVLPLKNPLMPNDDIQLISCSLVGANYWGAALSAWTRKDLLQHCESKKLAEGEPFKSNWNSLGNVSFTCLGAMAAPIANL